MQNANYLCGGPPPSLFLSLVLTIYIHPILWLLARILLLCYLNGREVGIGLILPTKPFDSPFAVWWHHGSPPSWFEVLTLDGRVGQRCCSGCDVWRRRMIDELDAEEEAATCGKPSWSFGLLPSCATSTWPAMRLFNSLVIQLVPTRVRRLRLSPTCKPSIHLLKYFYAAVVLAVVGLAFASCHPTWNTSTCFFLEIQS